MKISNEVWKHIDELPGYQISTLGRVKALRRKVKSAAPSHIKIDGIWKRERILTTRLNVYGYPIVTVSVNGKVITKLIHRLIAKAFIPNPTNRPHINHINCIRNDNRIENLEWCTRSENIIHAYKMGRRKFRKDAKGENHGWSKLTENNVKKIRIIASQSNRLTATTIGREFGVCKGTITSILRGETWAHVK